MDMRCAMAIFNNGSQEQGSQIGRVCIKYALSVMESFMVN